MTRSADDDAEGGFVSLGVEAVHEWAMFRLQRRGVRTPTGHEFERTFVATPGAVGVVALDDDGRMMLVSQYRASVDSMVVEIPAGMRDVEGEDPSVTALRELREETGFMGSRIEHLGRCLSSPGVTDSMVELYLVRGLTECDPEPHGPEEDHMLILHVPFEEAVAMVMDGRVVDAKSVCAILLVARLHPELIG